MTLLKVDSTLEQEVLNGFDRVGKIGVAYAFKINGVIPFSWRVRVLTNSNELLPEAPYSLTFTSTCCQASIFDESHTDDVQNVCADCSSLQSWASTSSPLSILGSGRVYSLEYISVAASSLLDVNPLEADLLAHSVISDIERVHEEYMTPMWAQDTAEQVLNVWS